MFSIPPTPKYYILCAIIALLYLVMLEMSSEKVCMLRTKDEENEEGEMSSEMHEVPKLLQKVLTRKFRPLLPRPTSPSLPLSSKASLPALLPHLLSSTCSDIPMVCGVNNVVGGQTDASEDEVGQAHGLSKVLLCAISPWLARLIEGIPLGC